MLKSEALEGLTSCLAGRGAMYQSMTACFDYLIIHCVWVSGM